MASVTTENIGSLHEKLTVTVSKEDYYPSFEKSLKNYSKNANIQGFRKGAVPQGLVKKMYGKSIFVQEVINVANKQLEEYLKNNKTAIFGQPLALPESEKIDFDFNNPIDYNFDFEIGVKPEFEITPLNNKGSITKFTITSDDKMIDKEITNIRRKAGNLEDIEKVEEPTDVLYITYTLENNDPVEDISEYKMLPAKLSEILNGQSKDFTATFKPKAELTEEELVQFNKYALKTDTDNITPDSTCTLTLTKVARLQESDLNQELYEKTFPGKEIKDEAGFREFLKQEIEKELARITFERMQNDMFETLVHETPLELPITFLKNWLKQSNESKTDEEIENEFPSFEHQLRWQLISEKLINDLKLEVSFDEIMNDVKTKVLSYFGMDANSDEEEPEWIKGYLDKMAKDDKTMDETYRRLLFDKLFNTLATEWQVQEKTVNLEEFWQLAPAGHHHHHH